ncbi:hypothetical protein JJQ94_22065 [Pseudoalteromonas sp. GCY]|uniref:hypothetical protein n=1 Tax=Pseudoalteromonas sp. GCY TaxID=2003316 RepID=UPI00155484B4|nr:hypothetical protein [Pseudoalteromonas sp. GCY]QQQ66902.1 hypothetical protein JJQ94_22065 [Pseudoalteromonas sp. GCY]
MSDSAILGILIQAGVGIATIATIKTDVKWIKDTFKEELRSIKARLNKLEDRKC